MLVIGKKILLPNSRFLRTAAGIFLSILLVSLIPCVNTVADTLTTTIEISPREQATTSSSVSPTTVARSRLKTAEDTDSPLSQYMPIILAVVTATVCASLIVVYYAKENDRIKAEQARLKKKNRAKRNRLSKTGQNNPSMAQKNKNISHIVSAKKVADDKYRLDVD